MDREAEAAGELPEFDMPDMDDECTQPRTANEDDQLQTEPMDEDSEAPQRQETQPRTANEDDQLQTSCRQSRWMRTANERSAPAAGDRERRRYGNSECRRNANAGARSARTDGRHGRARQRRSGD